MLISTVFQHQSVTTLSKHITQYCRELYYHTDLPDSAVTFFSRCALSTFSSSKNFLADIVIQTTFCRLRFPRKMDVFNNESCRSNFHQNPDQYQNLDKIYSKFRSNCRIPRSAEEIWEGRSNYSRGAQCGSSEEPSRNFRNAQQKF